MTKRARDKLKSGVSFKASSSTIRAVIKPPEFRREDDAIHGGE
jgi:hypothetical protein